MLDKGHDPGLRKYLPLSILRDSESLVMVASEWGSTLPQLLLCPRGRWPCGNQEEAIQASCKPNSTFGHGHTTVCLTPD